MISTARAVLVTGAIGLALAAVTSAGAGWFAWTKRGELADADKAAAIATIEADAERRVTAANDRIGELERADAQRTKEAQDEQLKQHNEVARTLAALQRARTERDGLRDQLAAYAAGGTAGAADTVAACHTRAQALGALLDETLRTSEEGAADGESCNADLGTVLNAWPRGVDRFSAEVEARASE